MNKKPSEKSKLAFKLLLLLSAAIIMLGLLSFVGKKSNESAELVASNFATYDILRAVTKGTNQNIKLLVQPGTDIHHYEPSQQDIIDIQASKLFVYIGGESEEWVESIIQDEQKTLKLMNAEDLTILNEDGEDEIDEHIWTAPSNYILMLQATEKKLSEIYPENSAKYQENAKNYIAQIQEASLRIENIAKDLPTLIFSDRFPAKYFVNEFGLGYIAAFSGCAEDTEADPTTLAKIIDYTKESKAKYILTIELSDQKLAKTVAESTGAEILTFQSMQNISSEDFREGKTYLDLMNENIITLQKVAK